MPECVKIGGPPRIRTVFHPGKSRSFTIKVCDPNATRRRSWTAEVRSVKSWPAPVFASRKKWTA